MVYRFQCNSNRSLQQHTRSLLQQHTRSLQQHLQQHTRNRSLQQHTRNRILQQHTRSLQQHLQQHTRIRKLQQHTRSSQRLIRSHSSQAPIRSSQARIRRSQVRFRSSPLLIHSSPLTGRWLQPHMGSSLLQRHTYQDLLQQLLMDNSQCQVIQRALIRSTPRWLRISSSSRPMQQCTRSKPR